MFPKHVDWILDNHFKKLQEKADRKQFRATELSNRNIFLKKFVQTRGMQFSFLCLNFSVLILEISNPKKNEFKMKIEFHSQIIPQDFWNAVLISLSKVIRRHSEICFFQNSKKKFHVSVLSKRSILPPMVLWTRKMQFGQSCRKFSATVSIFFLESRNIFRNYIFL